MSIEPGSRLGPYEIVSRLGAGGMGEVFRARDTRVGREVAVKVLPPSFAASEERRQRFEQEARAAAALNHPNLLTIHDVGTADGVPYIVSELLEGETLREKLGADAQPPGGGAPLPARKAIDWASAVATGLAAAHDKGVVHRDLKPENVFVTSDGRVKILDFGLAKLTVAASEDASSEQTLQRHTSPGAVVGTVGYMSPEQVRGRSVDHRSDIFSLGAILYEMLAGRRAFRGDSAAETMSAILREDPPELLAAGAEIPAGLERIVRRCLEKSPEERFHSARDLAYALEAISGSSLRSARELAIPEAPRRARRAVALAAAAFSLVAAFFAGRLSTPGGAVRTELATPRLLRLTSLAGTEVRPSLSPDATSVVYSSLVGDAHDLFLQRVGGGNPINLTNSPQSERDAAFSPDGGRIAFSRSGGIWVMGASGESLRRLTDTGFAPAWAPDGRSIVFDTSGNTSPLAAGLRGELWRVDVVSGEKRRVEVGGNDVKHPSCSPDGRWIAFWGVNVPSSRRVIWIVPAEGGEARPLMDDEFVNWSPVWTPDSRALLFASDRGGSMDIWRMPIDPATGARTGPAERVTTAPGWLGPLTIAENGAIAFEATTASWAVERRPLDLRGGRLGDPGTVVRRTNQFFLFDPSPDGRSIAMMLADPKEDIVVFPVDEPSRQARLTSDAFRDRWPRWSADGSRVFFFSDRSGQYETWSARADGSDLRRESRMEGYPEPSPDGRHLLLHREDAPEYSPVLLDLAAPMESRKPEVIPEIREGVVFQPRVWSPDGHRLIGGALARTGNRDAATGTYAYTLASKSYEEILPGEPGRILAMAPDGAGIVRRRGRVIEVVDLRTRSARALGSVPPGQTRVTRDGTALYTISTDSEGDIWMLVPGTAQVGEAPDR